MIFGLLVAGTGNASAADICTGYGPQTPRDITSISGTNKRLFTLAPAAAELNLCNIHTHTNAEHKGPGFSVFAGKAPHGGYKCNDSDMLAAAELKDPTNGKGAFQGIKPGDTIEVHWVHSSCDIKPGKGLGSCLSQKCANPQLRVETQVFLVVNDKNALNFADFTYGGNIKNTGGVRGLYNRAEIHTGEMLTLTGNLERPPAMRQGRCAFAL